ncbi:hypothetical protein [Alkalihalobacterium bogoriense]|uniref:hypothetical protein n=1 Tax=Alkalihalobacterium bogoriense TaxID=246272 RepID=UPI00047E6E2F|nr:hypothetical protein [Alkalihalobacterium bogoriense]
MASSSFVFLGYIVVAVSLCTAAFGLARKSSLLMLVSSVTSLPLVSYFLGYNHEWMKFVWFIPFGLLLVGVLFWKQARKKSAIL